MGTLLRLHVGDFGSDGRKPSTWRQGNTGGRGRTGQTHASEGSAATRANDDRIGDKHDEFLGRHQVPS
jgi:hypothetical protein